MLDDGVVTLTVKKKEGNDIVCTVMNNAMLGNKKGVFMPGLAVDLPAMSTKDQADIK
jgi:pyruvate kinase